MRWCLGPNGSGKSNVVDAISWVLGTQSPATLRTNKMEDVIFAGTEKLSQKGFAEVNLNFEVDAEKFNGTDEISIGRKLYRDGQSEYFMNGLNCRLLDIQEFLSDVGIGKQQHTIISQGQIAEILNSKPEDHRITIEEAAGIPLAGLTAYQSLIDIAKLSSGETILIHAGSGGVGTSCRLSWRVAIVLANDPEGDILELVLPSNSCFGKEEQSKWPFKTYIQKKHSKHHSKKSLRTFVTLFS